MKIPILVNQKVIGTADNETKVFKKNVRLSKHLFKVLDAWGMDAELLHQLADKGYMIIINDLDEKKTYKIEAKKFKKFGQYYHFKGQEDHKAQIFLPRLYFSTNL